MYAEMAKEDCTANPFLTTYYIRMSFHSWQSLVQKKKRLNVRESEKYKVGHTIEAQDLTTETVSEPKEEESEYESEYETLSEQESKSDHEDS